MKKKCNKKRQPGRKSLPVLLSDNGFVYRTYHITQLEGKTSHVKMNKDTDRHFNKENM